jgi:hypothetical protein
MFPVLVPAQIRYEPERGELTGLIRLPTTRWDQADTWWLDCLATYDTEPPRTEALVLPVVLPDPQRDLLQEAALILACWCVVEAVVCHVRPPLAKDLIMRVQEFNAAQDARRIRARQAWTSLRAQMDAVHADRLRRRSIGIAKPLPGKPLPVRTAGRQMEMVLT